MRIVQEHNLGGFPEHVLDQARVEIARAFEGWGRERGEPMSMFSRRAYAAPHDRQSAIISARAAMSDDVVSLALRAKGALAVREADWASPSAEVESLWNSRLIVSGLKTYVREAFYQQTTLGVVTSAVWFGQASFRPSSKGPTGARRTRKVTSGVVPDRFAILPAEKIVRLDGFWGAPKLLWVCNSEAELQELLTEDSPTSRRVFVGRFEPTLAEKRQLADQRDVQHRHMAVLNPNTVWQSRLPGRDYGVSAVTPMSPVLPWLEIKSRLIEADRASLVGAANFILIFRIGTDQDPAKGSELEAFQAGMVQIARMPFIISDHRLQVDILTPDTAAVLNSDKHDAVNHRIAATTLGLPDDALLPGTPRDEETAARIMVAILDEERDILAESVARAVCVPASELSASIEVSDAPALRFTPQSIPLVGVTAAMNAVLAARTRRDLSRHSYLEALGFNHDHELARVRDEEESGADDIFQTHQPFDSPNANGGTPTGAMGQTGGRPTGDKTKPGQGKPKDGGQ